MFSKEKNGDYLPQKNLKHSGFPSPANDYIENPMDALNSAIDAREITKVRKFYYCPRDWIFLAKVPEGLSTYQALNDLSKEKFA